MKPASEQRISNVVESDKAEFLVDIFLMLPSEDIQKLISLFEEFRKNALRDGEPELVEKADVAIAAAAIVMDMDLT